MQIAKLLYTKRDVYISKVNVIVISVVYYRKKTVDIMQKRTKLLHVISNVPKLLYSKTSQLSLKIMNLDFGFRLFIIDWICFHRYEPVK